MVLADRVRDAYSMNGRVRKHHPFRFSFGIWLFPFHPHDGRWKPNGNLQFISWSDSLFVVIFSCYLFQCKADVITLSQHGFRFDASCLPFFFDSIPFPFLLNRRGLNRASILLLIPKNVSTDVSKLFFLLKLFSNSFIEASLLSLISIPPFLFLDVAKMPRSSLRTSPCEYFDFLSSSLSRFIIHEIDIYGISEGFIQHIRNWHKSSMFSIILSDFKVTDCHLCAFNISEVSIFIGIFSGSFSLPPPPVLINVIFVRKIDDEK